MSRKRLVIASAALLIVASSVGAYVLLNKKDTAQPVPTQSQATPAPKPVQQPASIRLIANGDLLPHDSVNQQAKTASGYDYKPFFSEIQSIYSASDVRFCNQEVPSAGEPLGISGYPVFNAPTEFARDISAVGCNVINIANNHINDKRSAGITKTREVWDGLKPLAIAGANRSTGEQDKIAYFDVKGVKFALLSYAEYSNNRSYASHEINILSEDLVKRQLSEASKNADVTLVSAHWGTEYSPAINGVQDRWANYFAQNGADIVLGTGPHVLQPVKKLKQPDGSDTLVYFSLGNLLSTQLDIESLIGGFAVIDIDPTSKKVSQIGFLPTYMHYEWTKEAKAREDLLSRRNLKIYPLASAQAALDRSLHGTTSAQQKARIEKLLNTYTPVPIYDKLP